MKKTIAQFFLSILLSALIGCSAKAPETEHDKLVTMQSQGLLSSGAFEAASFPEGVGIHGIDATRQLWFAAIAYPPSVRVARRLTGEALGALPPPSTPLPGGGSGFGAPVAVRVAPDGRILVLDGVVAPNMAGSAPAMLHEYTVAPTWSGFTATLVRSQALPLIPPSEIPTAMFGEEPRPEIHGIFFPIMMTVLPGGEVVVTDTVTGAAWVSDATRTTFRNALQDPRLRPLPQLAPLVGKGRAPGGGVRDYTLTLTTGAYPGAFGVAYLASTDEIVLANPSQGMLGLPRATFMAATDPTLKGAGVRPLAAPQLGVTDLVAGLDTNRFDAADPYVYFQRVAADSASSFENVMARVHGATGVVEVVARSTEVFDFDVAVAVVPNLLPIKHFATIGSGIGQEPNNPFVNATLGGVPQFVTPTLIGAAIVVY